MFGKVTSKNLEERDCLVHFRALFVHRLKKLNFKTKSNTTKSNMHAKTYDNIKWTQKTKARFSRLLGLRHPAWKRNVPILKEVDK